MAEHAIDWAVLKANLHEARLWMKRKQPEGAILSHHGHSVYVGGGLRFQCAPNGLLGPSPGNRPDETAVLIFDLSVQNSGEHDQWDPGAFDAETLARIQWMIEEEFRASNLVDSWNGKPGMKSASFLVRCDISGAGKAVQHYLDGCPVHHGPFCWGQGDPFTSNKDGCSYTLDGSKLLKEPKWVMMVEARQSEPAPEPPTRNGEVIAQVLEKVTPILVEMGFHEQTIHPSAAGVLEGEPGERVFLYEHNEMLGIQLPAESFAELVRLAAIGHEFDRD